jgi:hypothetical protein
LIAVENADKLKHEGSVYRYLNDVQGELIPVYLRNISLTRAYFLDINVRIVHMLHYRVEHHDVRPPNVLRSSEGGKVMLVDFEQSEILKMAPAL